MNQTKETAQNGLVFIADAIALLISYYLSGALWLHMYKGMNLNKVIGNLNDNVIIVGAAYAVAYLFYSRNGDSLRCQENVVRNLQMH